MHLQQSSLKLLKPVTPSGPLHCQVEAQDLDQGCVITSQCLAKLAAQQLASEIPSVQDGGQPGGSPFASDYVWKAQGSKLGAGFVTPVANLNPKLGAFLGI